MRYLIEDKEGRSVIKKYFDVNEINEDDTVKGEINTPRIGGKSDYLDSQ